MKIKAFVLRSHTNGDDDNAKGDVIDLPTSQFSDFKGVGLVREATDKEIADVKKTDKGD